jgi:hypothetical protein
LELELLDSETVWVFLSGSDEERFISDIEFYVYCLLQRKFPLDNILIFIDHPSGINFNNVCSSMLDIQTYSSSEIQQKLSDKEPKKVVILVTGHGSYNGIKADTDIKPYDLINTLRSINNLAYALIVLGQCFAGTFNFLDARSTDPNTGNIIPPEICIIGATNLTYSVSIPIYIKEIDTKWQANIFLLGFMVSIRDQIDIDGDGHTTVLDAYKLAGIHTTQELVVAKKQVLKSIHENFVTDTISQLTGASASQELTDKAKDDLMESLEIILLNQDYWILNANLARKLKF